MTKIRAALGICVAALLGLTVACGTTETPVADTDTDTASAAGSASIESGANGADGAATGPIEITDGKGRTFTLDGPATKVVSLEWSETEILASLGVMPVGAADIEGYSTWDTAVPLAASVEDVGTRNEPSIDAIIALEPDLVVMTGAGGDDLAAQLSKNVPVLVTTGSDASRQLDRLRDDVELLSKATGKDQQAQQLLTEMDSDLAAGKAAIEAAGASGTPFLMADGWKEGSAVAIRMFAKGSQFSDVFEALGLKNAWTGSGDKEWGLDQTDVEGLAKMTDPDLRLFYSASEEDVLAEGLADNAIWSSLPFVKAGQLTHLEKGTWTFGGPASVAKLVDQITAAYTG